MLIYEHGAGFISISTQNVLLLEQVECVIYGKVVPHYSPIIFQHQCNNLTICAEHNKENGELRLFDSFTNTKLNLNNASLIFHVDNEVAFKSLEESTCPIVAEIPLIKNTLTMNPEIALKQFDELFFVDTNKIKIPAWEKEFPKVDFMGCVPARYEITESKITWLPEIFTGITYKSKEDESWKEIIIYLEVAKKLIEEFPNKTIGMIVDSNFISEGKPMYYKYNHLRSSIWEGEALPENIYLIYYSSKDNFRQEKITKAAQKIRKSLPFYKGFKKYDSGSRVFFNTETLKICRELGTQADITA